MSAQNLAGSKKESKTNLQLIDGPSRAELAEAIQVEIDAIELQAYERNLAALEVEVGWRAWRNFRSVVEGPEMAMKAHVEELRRQADELEPRMRNFQERLAALGVRHSPEGEKARGKLLWRRITLVTNEFMANAQRERIEEKRQAGLSRMVRGGKRKSAAVGKGGAE